MPSSTANGAEYDEHACCSSNTYSIVDGRVLVHGLVKEELFRGLRHRLSETQFLRIVDISSNRRSSGQQVMIYW